MIFPDCHYLDKYYDMQIFQNNQCMLGHILIPAFLFIYFKIK